MITAFLMFFAESDPAWVLFLCAAMAISLLVYVFRVPGDFTQGAVKTRLAYLKERKDQVYENLRDLNFEYKAGKFPEADYEQMRAGLEDEAAALLAEIERLEAAGPIYRNSSGTLNKPLQRPEGN